MSFPFYKQPDTMDCGVTCLRMILKHYGKTVSMIKLREISETTKQGVSLKNISTTSEKLGFRTLGVKISFEKLRKAPTPFVVHWDQQHFVVVYKIKKDKIFIADPAQGLYKVNKDNFIKNWIGHEAREVNDKGIALLIEPTPKINNSDLDQNDSGNGFGFLFKYMFQYKKFIIQLFIGLVAGSLIQLTFPFFTQSIVDIGIQNQDINFIYLILGAQLFLFVGKISIELTRGWILLHLSTRINISLISDFFIKLMKLPITYFETKMTGDLLQRINDHQKIENLMTNASLSVLFSLINLFIFGGILAWFNMQIFAIFFIGSLGYIFWILLFMKKRKRLDYKKFSESSDEQSKVIELLNGMQTIKLNNAEREKRWGWEFIQMQLFQTEIKRLSLVQAQTIGTNFINEIKNLLITIFCAKLVIDGSITIGMMLAISYIIGQLNNPISQLIEFIHSLQDAKIAIERLSEIHNHDDEEISNNKINQLPDRLDINLKNIHFRYVGSSQEVIKGIDLYIPENKVTAIVGASGSGKTTLMKMLLKFYEPNQGEISLNNYNLKNISQELWRNNIGVVMQDDYIFNDTIANNITIGESKIDYERLLLAVNIANGKEFIESLPLGYNTMVGNEGVGMSGGQKQRLLIARAVYKNPKFIFFDEATSALDANNEKTIMKNLNVFFKQRTAVIIAHRLSTVKNADQIIVLDKGQVAEKGSHSELIRLKGKYFSLVKNQLELEKLDGNN